ncbi:MAG: DEAD/DEAH box helicase [Planctomycetes bacterium]|nr:DEAD/DEAH box helicase [Planctomycetota bacterium]
MGSRPTNEGSFDAVFKRATESTPYPYQCRLATESPFPQLLDIPTGLGKTAAAVLAWLWRRRFHEDLSIRAGTPRRLVYCLPMRVLVEQTYANVVRWLDGLGMLAGTATWDQPDRKGRCYLPQPELNELPAGGWASRHGQNGTPIAVHMLMGGEERTDWALWPERDAVLIGTQDMLLSRALNRGYAASRARWPIEFGLLHNDCLWVFDEVQLMGNGLATSAQFDALRKKLWKPSKSCPSLWMSATLGDQALKTRDRDDLGVTADGQFALTDQERNQGGVHIRLQANKVLALLHNPPAASNKDHTGILDRHVAGRLSLVIVNTVTAAQQLFAEIQDVVAPKAKKKDQTKRDRQVAGPIVVLLHSRLRPTDRRRRLDQIEAFRSTQHNSTEAASEHPGIVVVSTQVIEAGYDISGARLWSEICPWPSAVQRLGRLNREGTQPDARAFFWMPKADTKGDNGANQPNAKRIGPYEKRDLDTAKKLLSESIDEQQHCASYREALDRVLATDASRKALDVLPEAVLRPDDLFGLFSTEPDLAGGYTDVSAFVRSNDRDTDILVFWREFGTKIGPDTNREGPPRRDELCAVPFFVFRKFLDKDRCWEWDFETDRWRPRRSAEIFPGMTLLLSCTQGGYSPELGWTGRSTDVPLAVCTGDGRSSDERRILADSMNRDPASEMFDWYPIANHLDDVVAELSNILHSLRDINESHVEALETAAAWHDWGKSVHRWQKAVRRYAERVLERIDTLLNDAGSATLHSAAAALRSRFERGLTDDNHTLWAKFPNARQLIYDMALTETEYDELKSRIRSSFRPNLRHEAASALAAWQAWRTGQSGMSALAVYLIASHHGKVRTALRRVTNSDDVFGLNFNDELVAVPPRFPTGAKLIFDPQVVGSRGKWSDDEQSFTPADTCWVSAVVELLGPPPGCPDVRVSLRTAEPARIGPFTLAYLEAILRAADVRASRAPGQGVQS